MATLASQASQSPNLSAAGTGGIATQKGTYDPSSFASAPAGSYEASLFAALPSSGIPTQTQAGQAATAPVITSASAQADLAKKQSAFDQVQLANSQQQQKIAQQQMASQQQQQLSAQQAQQQKNVDTQNQQKQQEIDAKNAALGIATPGTTGQKVPVANYGDAVNDSSGNQVGTAKFDSNTGQPLNPGTPEALSNRIDSTQSSYLSGTQQVQDQKDQLAQQQSSLLDSVLNGTIPLSQPQQALIGAMRTQLAQSESEQRVANASYTGAVTEAGFRAGGEYTPSQYAGEIANSISYGVAKIAALDNAAAKTIADLEQGFQKQNFDVINQKYDVLSKQLDDKDSHIKDMYDTVTKSLQDQRDFNLKQQETTYNQVTKPIQDIAEEMFKNGAPQSLVDQARQSSTPGQALSVGGKYIGLLDRQQQTFNQNLQTQQLSISKANLAINQAELKLKQNDTVNNPEGTLNGKPQNASQASANSYANRMNSADLILAQSDKYASIFSQGGSGLNIFKSADRQAFEQAKSNFATAVLRRESGAAISPSEFAGVEKTYFPQIGDKKEVLDAKSDLRNTVINNFYHEANVARPVLPGMIVGGNDGKKYKVDTDGETLIPLK